jgi:ATP-dependent protease HslVU (ClpYQ) peptidase subunit
MASDSKSTNDDGAFCTRVKKIYRLESGALLGAAGDCDARDVIRLLEKVRTVKTLPTRQQLADTHCDFSGVLVLRNGEVFYIDVGPMQIGEAYEWAGSVVEVSERIAAVGSGQKFAIGAMAAGKSASEAVTIACRYDSFSGTPVHEVTLKL